MRDVVIIAPEFIIGLCGLSEKNISKHLVYGLVEKQILIDSMW